MYSNRDDSMHQVQVFSDVIRSLPICFCGIDMEDEI